MGLRLLASRCGARGPGLAFGMGAADQDAEPVGRLRSAAGRARVAAERLLARAERAAAIEAAAASALARIEQLLAAEHDRDSADG
ncbi:MAG: hypothetical protein RQ833_07835 [Sphingomonadaceae bacterium]|nr:hypothetical protein [Sphingomonadaceae bacterium]